MTSDDNLFVSRGKLIAQQLLSSTDDLRDPRVRARLRVHGYVPLYEGKSFWLQNPYFGGARERESISRVVAVDDIRAKAGDTAWTVTRLSMRNVASSTNQRTYIVGLIPPAAHGNSSPTIDGLTQDQALEMNALLSSLVVDYIVRMKVSTNLNWFLLETIPIVEWDTDAASRVRELTLRLNAVGAEFASARCSDPLLDGQERMAARLLLDALAAAAYNLTPEDLTHIAAQFPIYDNNVPAEYRYPNLVVDVLRALYTDGPSGAERRANDVTAARRNAGHSFGLDEIWHPPDGWATANKQADAILIEGADY